MLRTGVWAARDAGAQGRLGRIPIRAAERPVASARHEHVVGAVHQPVQGAFSQDGVGEQPIPVLGRAVGGHDHGAGLVAVTDELEQVLGLGGRELADAEVVQDEQVGSQVAAQAGFPGTVGVAAPRS